MGDCYISRRSSQTIGEQGYTYIWTKLESNMPISCYLSGCCIYNNQIHILGGDNSGNGTKHYAWDGTNWQSVSTLPYSTTRYGLAVYDNKLHLLGGDNGYTKHYAWDGTSWQSASTLPYSYQMGACVIYNNKINILGTITNVSSASVKKHYAWDGTSWQSVSTLPYSYADSICFTDSKGLHIIDSENDTNNYRYHYTWNGSLWRPDEPRPISESTLWGGDGIVYNNNIHCFKNTNHYVLQRREGNDIESR